MNEIISPLKSGMHGASVADLQDLLQMLLERSLLLPHNDANRRELAAAIQPERDKQSFSDATAKAVSVFQREHGLPLTGEIDEATAKALNHALTGQPELPPEFQYLARGQVLYRGGLPIANLTVRAFHRDLRQIIELGDAPTDGNGNFEIYYNPGQSPAFVHASNDRPPDLVVRALDDAGKVLVETPTRFAAQPIEKFRLVVDGGPGKTYSEFEQLSGEIKPYLRDLAIGDLAEDDKNRDVTLLSGKLAQDPFRVAAFAAAHKMAAEVDGDPAVFYALIRKGLPSNLPELLAVPPGTRSRALVGAIRDGIAPGALVGQVRKMRTAFDRHGVTFASKQAAGRARLGAVLGAAVGDRAKLDGVLGKLVTNTGPVRKMWQDLANDQQFKAVVPDAQVALQLAALTGRHLPLMNTLLTRRKNGKLGAITELAQLSEADWLALINDPAVAAADRVPASIPGRTPDERAKVYAATLRRIVKDTMPTRVLAYKAQADATQPASIKTFWKNVTDGVAGFEFGHGPIRPYLAKNPKLVEGVADKEALFSNLERTQRLFNLTTNYDEQAVLNTVGLTSALAVARLGQTAFVQKMSGTAMTAERSMIVYERAARVAAATLALATEYNPAFNKLTTRVLPDPTVVQAPDLETLFGTFDLCACDQCRSVHGAAAYFADLLAFLGDRASKTAGVSARDVLFARRPDLGEVELTCANTNTVLSYSDLVTEILERRIAPFVAFDLAAAAEAELDAKTLSAAVRTAFTAHHITLDPAARVVVGSASKRWSITDCSTLFSIVKNVGAITVTGAWPQTGASATSLAAVPEHVNPAAYTVLRGEMYPWVLPLDLPTEQTRVFLSHLGSRRHELMADLFAGGPSAALDNTAIAAEYLGLSDAERQYVTGAVVAPNPVRQEWEFWGLQQNANTVTLFDPVTNDFVDKSLGWVEALSWIRETLRRSALQYDELVRVLGCLFVNPGLTVRIQSADPNEPATCDTAKLTLTNFTAGVAGRLTRFVRLWRKIGGDPEDLDAVITLLAASTLDDAAIWKLSHVMRLKSNFGISVTEVIALWAAIPSAGADSLYARLFQNPDVLTPVDSAFALAGNELAIVAANPAEAKISKHRPTVLAALRVSAADLAALQAAGVANDDNLTLANLSNLYRHILLAQNLQIGIQD
ncbi:MAG: hypothetical protein JWM88_2767, partial [Verrucomicrobia bacterium]|nr:hypothetical protein [Verrucomicrobiota bacterium]